MRSIVRLLGATSVALGVLAFASPASAQAPRMAFIDSRAVMAEAPGRAEAEQRLQGEMTRYRGEVQRMSDSLEAMIGEYNRQQATLSPAAREQREQQIRTRQEEYRGRTQRLEGEIEAREDSLVRPIMERINRVIEEIRAADGYAFIFDVGAQANSIVAADPALNITPRVIERLRAGGGAATAAPAQQQQRPAAQPAQTPTRRPTPGRP